MPSWFRLNADGGSTLFVRAQPGAKRTEVAGVHGDALKIRVAAPALEGRANDELVDFIAERLGIAKRDVTLAAGARSRDKRFILPASADPARLLD